MSTKEYIEVLESIGEDFQTRDDGSKAWGNRSSGRQAHKISNTSLHIEGKKLDRALGQKPHAWVTPDYGSVHRGWKWSRMTGVGMPTLVYKRKIKRNIIQNIECQMRPTFDWHVRISKTQLIDVPAELGGGKTWSTDSWPKTDEVKSRQFATHLEAKAFAEEWLAENS